MLGDMPNFWGLCYNISASLSIWNFGFFMVTISWRFLSSFMFCMSLSSVIRASQLFMADERMRQSIKSLSMFLSLKAVCRIVLSCIGRIFIVSLYSRALMPLEILSGGINPEAAYLAPFAASSNIVMSLMKIWCPLRISLVERLSVSF